MPGDPLRFRRRGGTGPLKRQRVWQEACDCHSLCLCEFQATCYAAKAGCAFQRGWRSGRHATGSQAQQHTTRRRSWWHQLSVVILQTSTNTTSSGCDAFRILRNADAVVNLMPKGAYPPNERARARICSSKLHKHHCSCSAMIQKYREQKFLHLSASYRTLAVAFIKNYRYFIKQLQERN